MFNYDTEVVKISVVNENIQVDFSDDNIPVDVWVIDLDVVGIIDNK